MRILLATPSIRREVGGPSYSVASIDTFLQLVGFETAVLTRRGRGGVSMSALGHDSVFDHVNLVHNFGTWTLFNHQVSVRARKRRIPQVFCPMGMLEPWALSQKNFKKRNALQIYQRRDIAHSAAVHATAYSEARNLRALGVSVPIAVIPHGMDVPARLPGRSPDQRPATRTVLFMSRIHPKKGLIELVEAWAQVRPHDCRIVIAGPDQDGYQTIVEQAVRAKGLQDVFTFTGPVFGDQKAELFAQADLFVLPTYSENFGLVIAEALAHSIPVITTTGAPWEELKEFDCGWWIPPAATSLTCALAEALSLPSLALAEMGARGRTLIETRYAWSAIIEQHKLLYDWVLGGGQTPDYILRAGE